MNTGEGGAGLGVGLQLPQGEGTAGLLSGKGRKEGGSVGEEE